jgi:hypothetical protein
VSDPRLEMVGNTIQIAYDILNSTSSQEFTVDLIVKDEDGNVLRTSALTGDVGEKVSGGKDKRITWDLEADRIEINADIYVKVYVKAVPPPETVSEAPGPYETSTTTPAETARDDLAEESPPTGTGGTKYSRSGLILQSVAFPGLGLTRYKGGPHWVRGVLGYGCIAGSVIMNRTAIHTYDDIISQAGYDAKNSVYKKSLRQDQVSEVLAYTAVAIWISDLVWTYLGTSDLGQSGSRHRGLRISPCLAPDSGTPLLSFTYRF